MKPKYHVGDVLYRKDTKKKATIEQIVKYDFGYSGDAKLCYLISEPLNHKNVWSDVYLRVDCIDSDDNFCDFKVSGEPKYHKGDKIECLSNGRVVQIDLVSSNKSVNGSYRYHVTPWLFHPNEDGYHWCNLIDDNAFIQKTDKEVSTDPKYKVGDVIVYTDEENHNEMYFALIKDKTKDTYILSSCFPKWRRSMEGCETHNIKYIENNDNIRLSTEKEKHHWLEERGEFHTREEIIYNGVGYRITGKHILIENEKAGVYYSINMEYNNNFTIPIEDGDKEFKRQYNCDLLKVPNYTDPVTAETKDAYINRKAMEIYFMTFKHYMEKGGHGVKQVSEISSKAADNFKKKFGKNND